jgi:hypothetical protein
MTKSKDLRDIVIAHYQSGENALTISIMLSKGQNTRRFEERNKTNMSKN